MEVNRRETIQRLRQFNVDLNPEVDGNFALSPNPILNRFVFLRKPDANARVSV
jgi:hypothetical protein